MEQQRRPGFTLAAFAVGFAVVAVIPGLDAPWDAGLGCPDCLAAMAFWGYLRRRRILLRQSVFTPRTFEADKAWPEMIHRYFAGSLGLLILGIVALALKNRGPGQP